MACKIIGYDADRNRFNFGSVIVRQEQIGRKIADALIHGEEKVDFGPVNVTVNYLTEMLSFVAEHGWFWDNWDICTGDHDFDENVPTPGNRFGRVHELRWIAKDARARADRIRSRGQGRRSDVASELDEMAAECDARVATIFEQEGNL